MILKFKFIYCFIKNLFKIKYLKLLKLYYKTNKI